MFRRVAVVAAMSLGLLGLSPWQASAHTELTASVPSSGSTISTAPADVVLTFGQEIETSFATVVVRGIDGLNRVSSDPRISGAQLRVPIDGGLPAGLVTVGYRVISIDGHPVTGKFDFTLAEAPDAPNPVPPTAGPAMQASAAAETAPSSDDSGSMRILYAAAGGLLVGGAYVAIRGVLRSRRRSAGKSPRE